MRTMRHISTLDGNGNCTFRLWAPLKEGMQLQIVHPFDRIVDMKKENGYFTAEIDAGSSEVKYFYRPEGGDPFPDPASQFQPDGLHKASQLVDHSKFEWTDRDWRGIPLKELILYELHVGTFTPEGTFDAIIPKLPLLAETGINAIEMMPVTQFPGSRNWGYDGVHPYAVHNTYGGPDGLKRLVDACHRYGIAVILDVVFNHLGPEGNYFAQFGPYFNHQYQTPWGDALNFDAEWSDGVRDFFSQNLLYWIDNFHIDGFRLDAIHTVFDNGAVHFWELCHANVKEAQERAGRPIHMIAESDLNSPKVISSIEAGGYGFDAQWLDDMHHALYVILDEKGKDRYADFGKIEQVAKAYTDGFVFSGEFVGFRKRKYGRSSAGVPGGKFIVFNQNHDQIGNRVLGERLSMLVDRRKEMAASAAILLSPYIPMFFMGEEFGARTPFFYFVDHSEKELIELVREGRKKEFEHYGWDVDPPDPQDRGTFQRSKLDWIQRDQAENQQILKWNRHLIALRRTDPILCNFDKQGVKAIPVAEKGLMLQRQDPEGNEQMICLFNFGSGTVEFTLPALSEEWIKILDLDDPSWHGNADQGIRTANPERSQPLDRIELHGTSVVVFRSAPRSG